MKIEDFVSEVRANGVSSSLLSDANLQYIIGRAFRIYNRYLPRTLHSTITTVAYQGEYAVEDDAIKVVDVLWEPTLSSDIITRVLTDLKAAEMDFHYPSLTVIFDMQRQQMRNTTSGHWRMYGRSVRLIPVPETAGEVVPYIYTAPWADVDDIPIGDEDILIDGVMAMSNMALARGRVGTGGWRAGDYQVEGGSASDEMSRSSDEYSSWISRMAGGGVGVTG